MQAEELKRYLANKVQMIQDEEVLLAIKTIMRGEMIGYRIMRIRLINIKTKKRVTIKQYLQYINKSTKHQSNYTQIFHYYLSYDSRYVQNEPMKKFGMVLVDSNKYRKFIKEMQYNKAQLNQLQNQNT